MGDTDTDSLGYRPQLHFDQDVENYFINAFGAEHFRRISDALTRPSSYACIRVNTVHTSRQEVINKLSSILGKDHADNESDRGLCIEHPILKNVVIVKGDGPHKIIYSEECGQLKEVVVSRKCAEAVLRGANVFVPGVLACSGHVEQGDIVAVSVAIERLDMNGDWVVGITRGTVLLSEHGKAQMDDMDRRYCYIGKGKALLSRTAMFREHQGVAVEMTHRVYRLPSLHGVLKGDIFLQNLPSIVAAAVLDPQPGEYILDMCAAPGGKSTAIAIHMEDRGKIVAIDRSNSKVMDITRLAEEMKLTSIQAFKLNALKSVQKATTNFSTMKSDSIEEMPKNLAEKDAKENAMMDPVCYDLNDCKQENKASQYKSKAKARKEARRLRNGPGGLSHMINRQMEGFPPHSFDRVLLDPPCSALGLRPRLFAGEETIENLRRHSIYQKRMIDQAVQLCRPGGFIVYSTCTINPGENEAVVRYALDTYNCLSLVQQTPTLGGPGLTGGLNDGVSYKEWLREEEKDFVQRFDPSGPLDTIGFFIAKLRMEAS